MLGVKNNSPSVRELARLPCNGGGHVLGLNPIVIQRERILVVHVGVPQLFEPDFEPFAVDDGPVCLQGVLPTLGHMWQVHCQMYAHDNCGGMSK